MFHLISEELKNAQSYTKDFKQQILDLRGTLSPPSQCYVVAHVLLRVKIFCVLISFNVAFCFVFYAVSLASSIQFFRFKSQIRFACVGQSIHLYFAVNTDKLLEEQETTRKKEEFVAHLKSKLSETKVRPKFSVATTT